MVLKGIVLGLFLLFFHWMVLKGWAIMTYGLQMGSISSVDSAVGGLDHVRASTFQYFSHCTSYLLNRACALFVGKNCTFSLTLRTHRSLALWALSKFSFCFSWSWMSFYWIWGILTHFDGLERTVPCAGHPCRISAGDGRSAVMGVLHSWSSAWAWALGDPSVFL